MLTWHENAKKIKFEFLLYIIVSFTFLYYFCILFSVFIKYCFFAVIYLTNINTYKFTHTPTYLIHIYIFTYVRELT